MDRRAIVSHDLRVRFVISSGRDAAVVRLERFERFIVTSDGLDARIVQMSLRRREG
jgi:hypothetical protein